MSLGPNSVNAAQLYQWPRVRQDFPFKAQVLDELPHYDIKGGSVRTATVPKFDPDNFADIVPFCDEITDRTRQPEARIFEFAEIGSSYTICYTAQDPQSWPNDQDAEQGKLATDTVTYKYLQMLDDGVAGVGSFNGLTPRKSMAGPVCSRHSTSGRPFALAWTATTAGIQSSWATKTHCWRFSRPTTSWVSIPTR